MPSPPDGTVQLGYARLVPDGRGRPDPHAVLVPPAVTVATVGPVAVVSPDLDLRKVGRPQGWVLAAPVAVAFEAALASPAAGGGRAGLLLLVVAGVGALSAWLVSRPVTAKAVGRSELALRVVVVWAGAVLAIFAAESAAGVGRRSGYGNRILGWAWPAVMLAIVAAGIWRGGATAVAGASGGGPLPPLCAAFKRVIDLAVVLVSLPIAIPVVVLSALAIAVESRGGCLFVQTRLGKNGRPFRLAKLRTMAAGNDDAAHRAHMAAMIAGAPISAEIYGKQAADPRRTRVGRVLRRWSVDELPQLWNVWVGDMTVVGPRPPLPWEAAQYTPRMWGRLVGKPGLTGLWQVEGRGRLPFSKMVELDIRYWEEWSLIQELKILARTPKAVLWSRNTA